MKNVPENELFSAYLDGELTADEQAQMDRLLAESPEARQLLDEFRAISSTLQSLPQSKLGEDLGPRILRMAERRILAGESAAAAPDVASAGPPWYRRLLRPRNLLWPALAAGVAVAIYCLGPSGRDRPIALRAPAEMVRSERPMSEPPSMSAPPAALAKAAEEARNNDHDEGRTGKGAPEALARRLEKREAAMSEAKPAAEAAPSRARPAEAASAPLGTPAAAPVRSVPAAPAKPPAAAAPAPMVELKSAKAPQQPGEMGPPVDAHATGEKPQESDKKSGDDQRPSDAPAGPSAVIAGKGPAAGGLALKQKASPEQPLPWADRGKEGGMQPQEPVVVRLDATAETPSIQLLREVLRREQSADVQVLEAGVAAGAQGGGFGAAADKGPGYRVDAKDAVSSQGPSAFALEVHLTDEQLERALGALRSRTDLLSAVTVEHRASRDLGGLQRPVQRARPSAPAGQVGQPGSQARGASGTVLDLELQSQVASPSQMPGLMGQSSASQSAGRAPLRQAETSAGASVRRFSGQMAAMGKQDRRAPEGAAQRVLFVLHLPQAGALAAPKVTNMAAEKVDAARSEPPKASAAAPARP